MESILVGTFKLKAQDTIVCEHTVTYTLFHCHYSDFFLMLKIIIIMITVISGALKGRHAVMCLPLQINPPCSIECAHLTRLLVVNNDNYMCS